MKKLLFVLLAIFVFLVALSFVSAKEETHFEIEQISAYAVKIVLKDSSNNPIPGKSINVKITKPNGYVKVLNNKKLTSKGTISYFLGSNKGEYVVSVQFKGDSKYAPSELTKSFNLKGSSGKSMENYYQNHNYGTNGKMDDYMIDNYWSGEIYDDPNYDGEGP
ncbi:MAG: hypothetical protein K6A34_05825 [Methanobrevibacter sp.]|nr:hypothetical protein [Methanobrevibacter sp.]